MCVAEADHRAECEVGDEGDGSHDDSEPGLFLEGVHSRLLV